MLVYKVKQILDIVDYKGSRSLSYSYNIAKDNRAIRVINLE